LVNEWVVNHDRVELVRAIEDPIGIRGRPSGRKGEFVVEFINEIDGERGLWESGGTGTALVNAGASGEGGLAI
jgi:hypothetical protein